MRHCAIPAATAQVAFSKPEIERPMSLTKVVRRRSLGIATSRNRNIDRIVV